MKIVYIFLILLIQYPSVAQHKIYIDPSSDSDIEILFKKVVSEDSLLGERVRFINTPANARYTLVFAANDRTRRYSVLVLEGTDQMFIGSEDKPDPTIVCPRKGILRQFLLHNAVSRKLFGPIQDKRAVDKLLSNDLYFKIYGTEKNGEQEVDSRSPLFPKVKNQFYIDSKKAKMQYDRREQHWVLNDSALLKRVNFRSSATIKIPGYQAVEIDNRQEIFCNWEYVIKLKKENKVFNKQGFTKKEYFVTFGAGLAVAGATALVFYYKAKNDYKASYKTYQSTYDPEAYRSALSDVRRERKNAKWSQSLIAAGVGCTFTGFILKRK
jgi:hypothetical protein